MQTGGMSTATDGASPFGPDYHEITPSAHLSGVSTYEIVCRAWSHRSDVGVKMRPKPNNPKPLQRRSSGTSAGPPGSTIRPKRRSASCWMACAVNPASPNCAAARASPRACAIPGPRSSSKPENAAWPVIQTIRDGNSAGDLKLEARPIPLSRRCLRISRPAAMPSPRQRHPPAERAPGGPAQEHVFP